MVVFTHMHRYFGPKSWVQIRLASASWSHLHPQTPCSRAARRRHARAMYASRPSRIALGLFMGVARRSLLVSREYRHQAKPDAEIGMWRCLLLIFARDMERPKCRVHVHGHARHFPARSVIDHDPIVISVCVQVPRDTRRLSALPSDLISALIFGVRAVLGSMMYLRRGCTVDQYN